jgi:hypothetical protein
MLRTMFPTLIAVALTGGCLGSAQLEYRATISTPDLVTVTPGIQVIADYDEPIFYTDGFYWRNYDNAWYRSSVYTGSWIYIDSPPVAITRIQQPRIYAHYRPTGYVARSRPVPARQLRQPTVRDRRAVEVRRAPAATPAPTHIAPRETRPPVNKPGYGKEHDRDHERDHGKDHDRDHGKDHDGGHDKRHDGDHGNDRDHH